MVWIRKKYPTPPYVSLTTQDKNYRYFVHLCEKDPYTFFTASDLECASLYTAVASEILYQIMHSLPVFHASDNYPEIAAV